MQMQVLLLIVQIEVTRKCFNASNTRVTFTRIKTGELNFSVANINLHGANLVAVDKTIRLNTVANPEFSMHFFLISMPMLSTIHLL